MKISQIYTEDGTQVADIENYTYFYYADHNERRMLMDWSYKILADAQCYIFYLCQANKQITPVKKSDGNFFLPNVFTTQAAAYSALKARMVKELDELIENAKSRGV